MKKRELTDEDLELIQRTRENENIDLVLDTTDSDWLRESLEGDSE